MKVAVIGAGIAGLAAAWELRQAAGVTVFDPDPAGGRIRTAPFRGLPVDEGPDAFLTRVPEAVSLCRELGIDGELVAPVAGRTMLWYRDRLRPLPEGLVLGVPRQLGPLAASGILSPVGLGRAALDLVLPRRRAPRGLTVRDLVADRFGSQVADRLVDPLVGGIHAGSTADLAAAEVVPQLVAAAERSRSLLLGLRQAAPSGPAGPVFLAPRGGMARLVEALVEQLRGAGAEFVTQAARSVRRERDGRLRVGPGGEVFDAVVIATPAATAAALVADGAAAGLASIPRASVALVTMAVSGVDVPEGVNGFLVPAGEGRLMTACSFASSKWPHWAAPGETVLRVSAGRYRGPSPLSLDDETLASRLAGEVAAALGRRLSVSEWRVSRWPDAFPQYRPGHRDLVARAEADLRRNLPRVALAGASYQGSGIPACIASGRRAARQAAAAVGG